MPWRAEHSPVGLIFRVPLASAPGGSALLLRRLENGTALEDAAFLDFEIQEDAGDAAAGLVVFQQPEIGLYQRLVEAARHRLAELELEFGISIAGKHFHPVLHAHDPEKRKTYERLDGKGYDRMMDRRIISEDRFARWSMEYLARKFGIDVWLAGSFLLRIQ